MSNDAIHDRVTMAAGKVFIKEGDDGFHAYLIQSGKARVFTERNGEKVELAVLDSGAIVGEASLIMDEPRSASVEAVETCTLIVITREQFERKLIKTDDTVTSVLKLLTQRLHTQNLQAIDDYEESRYVDEDAEAIMESFSRTMKEERKSRFMREIMPHMNGLIKALKAFKAFKSG